MKKTTLALILLLFSLNILSQNTFNQKKYSVTAKNGLIIRNKPNVNAEKIGKIDYNKKIIIIEKTNISFETESVKGYWVKIKTNDLKYGFVFNGFLKLYTEEKIIYALNRNDKSAHRELKSVVNNKEITLISFEDRRCFEIIEEQDYNNDGYEEILLEMNVCGGNCCGNTFLVFSYNGDKFHQTEEIGYDWNGIELQYDENNIRHFVVDIQNEGHGNTSFCQDKKEIYTFKNFQFKLTKVKTEEKINAIIELKSEDFLPKETDTVQNQDTDKALTIEFDLDNNGIKDKISSEYWSRWGSLYNCKIIFNNGLDFHKISNSKRIGILQSKTNSVNDLVIGCNTRLIWNGKEYKKE